MNSTAPVLFGNSFSMAVVRRPVTIEPVSLDFMRSELQRRPFLSFWGHVETLAAVRDLLGVDVTPLPELGERPQVMVSPNGLPMLNGQEFMECLVLPPVITRRPDKGEVVSSKEFTGWNPLHIQWHART